MRISRRAVLGAVAGTAASSPGLAGAGADRVTGRDLVTGCETLAGTRFTAEEALQMTGAVDAMLDRLRLLRGAVPENGVAPATTFDPRLPGWQARPDRAPRAEAPAIPPLPRGAEDLAFAPAWHQAAWIATGQLKSVELTHLYLARIAARAVRLNCMATVTADLALRTAARCDAETRAGRSRGPLHGLPYGLKDLIDTAGIVTGWGAEPYRRRTPDRDATIVGRLAAAGAVLIAKTSCGALAYGDLWYGGRTRNPWHPAEGSAGSSAGSAAAVADGLCSFAIGTETMGSIVAPSARCGAVGLRPTFGRVPRTGVMALCWSYDKVGPLARDPHDAALVLAAMAGADGVDPGAIAAADVPPLAAPPAIDPGRIVLGYRPEWFEQGPVVHRAALAAARALGFRLVEVALPTVDLRLLGGLIVTESAAAFEQLTLDDQDDLLGWQADAAWPNSWRAARFEPAIGYIQAQRHRRLLMEQFAQTMAPVDAILHPAAAGGLTAIGNHTGCPAITLPAGFARQPVRAGGTGWVAPVDVSPGAVQRDVPFNVTLTGHPFEEPLLGAIAATLAQAIGLGGRRP